MAKVRAEEKLWTGQERLSVLSRQYNLNDDQNRSSSSCSCSDSCSSSSRTCSRCSVTGDVPNEEYLPYPGFVPVSLYCLKQDARPRNWCIKLITNPWFERISIIVILLNCITLGMYQPCPDDVCESNKCKLLQVFDDLAFTFFAFEMVVKITAMGFTGKGSYMADSWNRLDSFIIVAGCLEYCLDVGNINLSAIRTIRVLRPLRAINRIPSMRILVMLLLDTLPMLGNVLLLCFFVFFIFGIVGVQLWAGLLRQRCYLELPPNVSYPGSSNIPSFYKLDDDEELEYICSLDKDGGMHRCANLPPYEYNNMVCNASAVPSSNNSPQNGTCVNWNQYYTLCRAGDRNPFQGAISFDNIGLAWVAIFLVISLEGWSDIMYYVQDAHSFWDWIYFVLLIVIGSFFMINLCLVVIATQFSETKKREMERMRMERARFHSNSTLTSNSASEPTSCYTEIIKYLAHLWRRARRKFCRWYRHTKRKRRRGEVPHAISLRTKRIRPPWQPGQSALKRVESVQMSENVPPPRDSVVSNENSVSKLQQEPSDCTVGTPTSDSPPAPCASPEISDIDPVASPRRPTVLKVSDPEHRCSGAECTLTIEGNDGQRHSPSPKTVILRPTRNPSSGSGGSRRTSQLTCAELLALSGAQSAALAASLASNYTMQRFYSTLRRERKHYSAPHLLFYYPEEDKDLPLSFSESGWTDSELDSELDDDGECHSSRGKCYQWWKICQATIKKIVDHRYFQRGILTAILVNTLSMGIEYHNQPEELTQAVELSNLIFTGIFSTEMVMKLLGDGFCGYIRSGFNVFDGVIVILSVIELSQSSGSGLSVLRTFRLLRILKLVRFMPALRRQLVIMLRTVDNVAVFFALLILFIFIFRI